MKLHRRRFLHLAAAAMLPGHAAQAQAWPARPIRLMVGFVAGGRNDILARLVAEWLTARLGQQVTVENNASSNAATSVVAHAPADGHTLMLIGPANAIGVTLSKNLDFDFRRDFIPIAGITREALIMVVNPSVLAADVEALFVYARANPGTVKMAETGLGTASQVTGELFRIMTGFDVMPVQFVGSATALRALVAGEVQVMFEPISAAIEPVRAGRLRALAVTTAQRIPALPEVPAMTEILPGFEMSAVTGIAAPRATPAEIVERLNAEINAAYADAAMKARFAETGGEVLVGSPAAFGKLFGGEIAQWARLLALSGVKAE
ncbi:MAG TPA: tripartite tricarboxylate transporter substrate-binding protein [Xanthobacteraceae bacterium]|nr:tripartite tricarboxylate transporter substrate-binding protein [Xanthobacteraceae bacterium]